MQPPTPTLPSPTPLLTTRALALFACLNLGFKLLPFERVYEWFIRRATRPALEDGDPVAQRRVILASFAAVRKATRFYYRKQKDCLPRALVTFYLIRRRGIPATLIFGVKKFPFGGHTWVESQDLVLDESPGRVKSYTPIKQVA